MIPSVFAAAFTIFPASKRAIVSPIIGLIATLAPTIGPTVGGYLSHALSWHWLFLVNVPIGVLVATFAWLLIDFDKPNLSLFHKFDWWGLLGMAMFLGALEYVLEEGPSNDWIQDETVRNFAMISAVGAVLFFWRAFTSEEPIVDLRAFSNVNFAVGSLFSFTLGVGLYGLTYLYPLYLGRVRGYDSLMIGETLAISGLVMFLSAPLAGILTKFLDLRIMLMGGFVIFAAGTWRMTYLTADWDYYELLLPQILRGVALMLCMVPINNLSLGTLPRELIKNGSGLYNLTRNLGGAFGLAIINTMLSKRADFHYARLAESVTYANAQAVDLVNSFSRSFSASGVDGQKAALAQLKRMVMLQASVMTYMDIFAVLTALFLTLAAAAMLMRKPPPEASGVSAH
jgi:DHA2 family multidrug resistance protein